MTQGIVLAGGYSSRAETNKMGFLYQGSPLILSTIETMMPYVTNIIVVSGHYHDELSTMLKDVSDVTIVYNKNYDQGMYASVKTGMADTFEDVFIIPGDVPLVRPSTYEQLKAAKGLIKVPSYNNRRGHPLFMDKRLRNILLESPTITNLKAFRDAQGFETIPVDDPGILVDIDTQEAYFQLLKNTNKGA